MEITGIGAILLVISALYVFGPPLLVRSQFRKPGGSGIREITADGIDADSRAYLDHAFAELQTLGFEFVCYVSFDLELDLMGGYGMVMAHPANRDLALALAVTDPIIVRYVEFSSEFEDGTEMNTNNSHQLPETALFPPTKRLFWFPGSPTQEVYAAHLVLSEGLAQSAKRVPPDASEMIETIKDGIREDFEYAAGAGLVYWNETEEAYRMTLLGAYTMTWQQLFPLSTIGKMQKRAADRRALRTAGGR